MGVAVNRFATLFLVSLCGLPSFGQHGGFGSGGSLGRGTRSAVVRSPRGSVRHSGFGSPGFYPYGFTAGYDSGGYDYEPEVMPVQPPAPQVIFQAPPREVRSEIHEYSAPAMGAAAAPSTESGEATSFVIALADGSLHSANAVWVQNGVLHYVDGEDNHHEVPLSSVDRRSTRTLNRERKLDLWLPAA